MIWASGSGYLEGRKERSDVRTPPVQLHVLFDPSHGLVVYQVGTYRSTNKNNPGSHFTTEQIFSSGYANS